MSKLKELERRLRDEPDNLGLRVALAGALLEAGRRGDAVELYRSVAIAYREAGRTQQALTVCRSLLEVAPEDDASQALFAMLTADAEPPERLTPAPASLVPRVRLTPPTLRPPSEDGERASSLDITPLPAPLPYHVADPTRTSMPALSLADLPASLRAELGAVPEIEGIAAAARQISAQLIAANRQEAEAEEAAAAAVSELVMDHPSIDGSGALPLPDADEEVTGGLESLESLDAEPLEDDEELEDEEAGAPELPEADDEDDEVGDETIDGHNLYDAVDAVEEAIRSTTPRPELVDDETLEPSQIGAELIEDDEADELDEADEAPDLPSRSLILLDDAFSEDALTSPRGAPAGIQPRAAGLHARPTVPLHAPEPPARPTLPPRAPEGVEHTPRPALPLRAPEEPRSIEHTPRPALPLRAPDEPRGGEHTPRPTLPLPAPRADARDPHARPTLPLPPPEVDARDPHARPTLSARDLAAGARPTIPLREPPERLQAALSAFGPDPTTPRARPQITPNVTAGPLASVLFAPIPPRARVEVLQRFQRRHAGVGTTVIRRGETGHGLILVVRGRLDVHAERTDGARVSLDTIGPNDHVGEIGLIGRAPAAAYVVAASDSELLILDPESFYELTRTYPALWSQLASVAERRARDHARQLQA